MKNKILVQNSTLIFMKVFLFISKHYKKKSVIEHKDGSLVCNYYNKLRKVPSSNNLFLCINNLSLAS